MLLVSVHSACKDIETLFARYELYHRFHLEHAMKGATGSNCRGEAGSRAAGRSRTEEAGHFH